MDKISEEDLQEYKSLQNDVQLTTLAAERSVALKQLAQAKIENHVLSLFHKYNLRPGVDKVTSDGTIQRGQSEPVEPQADQATKLVQPQAPVEGNNE